MYRSRCCDNRRFCAHTIAIVARTTAIIIIFFIHWWTGTNPNQNRFGFVFLNRQMNIALYMHAF